MSSYLQSLRRAKDALAVAKTEFATFVSGIPANYSILVFEGPDDKIAYAQWLRILKPDLKFESLVRKNKTAVLRLFDALVTDLTGLAKRAYYFVDRDYDDLQGRDESAVIFMTDQYSIENYCVSNDVLVEVLKDIFHCNGANDARSAVVDKFASIYCDFLKATEPINFRIFAGRKLKIFSDDKLPSRLNQFAIVELESAQPAAMDLEDLVRLTREPSDDEIGVLLPEFKDMEPALRYRGKFALLFFVRWLALLRADRQAENPVLFQGIPKPEFNMRGDFTFETLLPRVPPPTGLRDFAAQMA